MNEQLDTKPNRTRNLGRRLQIGGAIAVAAASGAVLGNHTASANEKPNIAAVAAGEITNDLALGHASDVVENGKAVVTMKNGSKVVISKPILETEYAANGKQAGTAVAERTRGSDEGETTAVTTYVAGENGVANVSVVEDGKSMTPAQADSNGNANQVELTRSPGLSGEGFGTGPDTNGDKAGYFTPANDQSAERPNEHIAQGAEFDPKTTS